MLAHFDKPLTIPDYAYLTGQSERSFRRNFKARFGQSPKKWLMVQRLEKAKLLLEHQDSLVKDVAIQSGYRSSSHFIESYRGRFGETPGQSNKYV